MVYDKVILGAGLYGLYSALYCGRRGEKVAVLEYDREPFMRATYINQARVHMGYHYPRSYSTAVKSAGYFDKFNKDYGFCIHSRFDQIYATSANFSWTSAGQFRKFCKDAGIRCEEMSPSRYFKEAVCDGVFLTEEYTYDAHILRDHLLAEISRCPKIEIVCSSRIRNIREMSDYFDIETERGDSYQTGFVLNAAYASVNQVMDRLGYPPFEIKYELCEIILCNVCESLKNVGLTVMDGPFFSIMPFGKTGYHSLTAVTFTPHMTCFDPLPKFSCQPKSGGYCSPQQLGNCNECIAKPPTAWDYMSGLARKYLRDNLRFDYAGSLFSMKPILKASEVDDSRPTVIRRLSKNPTFISVLSGKINTVYDLDEVLCNGNE